MCRKPPGKRAAPLIAGVESVGRGHPPLLDSAAQIQSHTLYLGIVSCASDLDCRRGQFPRLLPTAERQRGFSEVVQCSGRVLSVQSTGLQDTLGKFVMAEWMARACRGSCSNAPHKSLLLWAENEQGYALQKR